MPPRLNRRPITLLIAAKIVVIILVLVITTIVVSTIRAAIAPIIVSGTLVSPTTLLSTLILVAMFGSRTARFGAKPVDNTAASSAQTRGFAAAVLPVMWASARAGARTGCRTAVASTPAYAVRNSLRWGHNKRRMAVLIV